MRASHVLLPFLVWLSACNSGVEPAEPAPAPVADKSTAEATTTDRREALGAIRSGYDYHSYANPHEARVTHLALDLAADFEQQVLEGSATLTIERVGEGIHELMLDTRGLDIEDVTVLNPSGMWHKTYYRLEDPDPDLGSALAVDLPVEPAVLRVRINYRTSPSASGLQWLEPVQTAGKTHPFLFTQSQAIHARSWIPLQDTPGVRMTYEAVIRTPPELLAVMSAANDPATPRDGEYHFSMPQPIPSYLIALAVGDLVFESIGDRTGVYAAPSIVEAAALEFSDTQQMLETCEQMYGPYRWGRYDLLILPPSFPFGGMENPRLSFITPTVIAGDKSLVSLIAHELAHSWSGNLVTNASWRDLWLNEGFTNYLTTRIMEVVYGERRAAMESVLSYQDLMKDIQELPDSDQILAIDLRGRDPEDVFSHIAYAKGELFLVWLENAFGRERFDAFLKQYFDEFAFQSISTETFLKYLQSSLLATNPDNVAPGAVKRWVFSPGLPADAVLPESDAFEQVEAQSHAWLAGTVTADEIETAGWSVHEWLYFLNNLPAELRLAQLNDLDRVFGLTDSPNNEVAHSWLLIAIRHGYAPAYERLEDYLLSIGRSKLITPLYEELQKTEKGARFAARVYAVARSGYHPITAQTVDEILSAEGS